MLNLAQILQQEISLRDVFTKGTTSRSSKWAILLLRFNNEQNLSGSAPPLDFYERLFTGKGAGTLNVPAFFSDMSHGQLDLSESKVFDWMTINANRSDSPAMCSTRTFLRENSTATALWLSVTRQRSRIRWRSTTTKVLSTHSPDSSIFLACSEVWPQCAIQGRCGLRFLGRR